MEELILPYYLRIISLLITVFLIYFSYLIFLKEIKLTNYQLTIKKNQSVTSIVNSNISNLNDLEKILIETYIAIHSKFLKKIHFGKFVLPKKINLSKFISIITKPSNFILKITIIEGSNKHELKSLLKSNFKQFKPIEYNEILADTYFLHSYENFEDFLLKAQNLKRRFENKYKNHELMKQYSFDELLIIGSLLEKEGKDDFDKKVIFSVIQNRLKINMKLQIDASTIYALTNGKYDLTRGLKLNDLKIEHPYNTYFIKGLPPNPISYVGKKTMELIFENYKSEYLYYFYNSIFKKHIYSKNFEEHKRKLSDYRNQK